MLTDYSENQALMKPTRKEQTATAAIIGIVSRLEYSPSASLLSSNMGSPITRLSFTLTCWLCFTLGCWLCFERLTALGEGRSCAALACPCRTTVRDWWCLVGGTSLYLMFSSVIYPHENWTALLRRKALTLSKGWTLRSPCSSSFLLLRRKATEAVAFGSRMS